MNMPSKCRLLDLIYGYLHANQINCVEFVAFFMYSPHFFKGLKFTAQLFHCEVWITHKQIKGLE